jgi:flagellar hook-length control protein FliK
MNSGLYILQQNSQNQLPTIYTQSGPKRSSNDPENSKAFEILLNDFFVIGPGGNLDTNKNQECIDLNPSTLIVKPVPSDIGTPSTKRVTNVPQKSDSWQMTLSQVDDNFDPPTKGTAANGGPLAQDPKEATINLLSFYGNVCANPPILCTTQLSLGKTQQAEALTSDKDLLPTDIFITVNDTNSQVHEAAKIGTGYIDTVNQNAVATSGNVASNAEWTSKILFGETDAPPKLTNIDERQANSNEILPSIQHLVNNPHTETLSTPIFRETLADKLPQYQESIGTSPSQGSTSQIISQSQSTQTIYNKAIFSQQFTSIPNLKSSSNVPSPASQLITVLADSGKTNSAKIPTINETKERNDAVLFSSRINLKATQENGQGNLSKPESNLADLNKQDTKDLYIAQTNNSPTSTQFKDLISNVTHSNAPDLSKPDPTQVANTIIREAKLMTQENKTIVNVKLEPESLGSVVLKVSNVDGKLSAEINVKNADTHAYLEASIPQMKETLQSNGISLSHLSVNLSSGDTQTKQHNYQPKKHQFFRPGSGTIETISDYNELSLGNGNVVRNFGYNTIEIKI